MRRTLRRWTAAAATATCLLTAAPASANLEVCNKTDHPVLAALGFKRGDAWVSAGWWRIEPRKCGTLLRGVLKSRYYYLRGVHVGVDGPWEGNRFFCVKASTFTIKGRDNCPARGYGRAGFFEIDTGDRTTWTQNLSD